MGRLAHAPALRTTFLFPSQTSSVSSPLIPRSLAVPPSVLGRLGEASGSGGIGATLLYAWEMDERRFATRAGQLLPSVWWDVARAWPFTCAGLGWAFCLVARGAGVLP